MLQSRHRRLGEAAFNLQQPGKGTFKVLLANCKVKNFSHSGYPYSVAGIATCSRAATCWTTRWCTRPTGSSPSMASPSSAHHSATFTLASPPLPLHFCHRDSGTAVKKSTCSQSSQNLSLSLRSVPAVLHVPSVLPSVLLQAARSLLRPPGDPLALCPL